jgi:hypothetical protein
VDASAAPRYPKALAIVLTERLYANCPKAKAASVDDRCKAVYGKDSRWSASDSLKPA